MAYGSFQDDFVGHGIFEKNGERNLSACTSSAVEAERLGEWKQIEQIKETKQGCKIITDE